MDLSASAIGQRPFLLSRQLFSNHHPVSIILRPTVLTSGGPLCFLSYIRRPISTFWWTFLLVSCLPVTCFCIPVDFYAHCPSFQRFFSFSGSCSRPPPELWRPFRPVTEVDKGQLVSGHSGLFHLPGLIFHTLF